MAHKKVFACGMTSGLVLHPLLCSFQDPNNYPLDISAGSVIVVCW
jgi:hypothetical protein